MDQKSSQAIVSTYADIQGGSGKTISPAVSAAEKIVLVYAGSGAASASQIPSLFANLVDLFTTGKLP